VVEIPQPLAQHLRPEAERPCSECLTRARNACEPPASRYSQLNLQWLRITQDEPSYAPAAPLAQLGIIRQKVAARADARADMPDSERQTGAPNELFTE